MLQVWKVYKALRLTAQMYEDPLSNTHNLQGENDCACICGHVREKLFCRGNRKHDARAVLEGLR